MRLDFLDLERRCDLRTRALGRLLGAGLVVGRFDRFLGGRRRGDDSLRTLERLVGGRDFVGVSLRLGGIWLLILLFLSRWQIDVHNLGRLFCGRNGKLQQVCRFLSDPLQPLGKHQAIRNGHEVSSGRRRQCEHLTDLGACIGERRLQGAARVAHEHTCMLQLRGAMLLQQSVQVLGRQAFDKIAIARRERCSHEGAHEAGGVARRVRQPGNL
mmetsp:Transcript_36069/g.103781  ORF Transcript_36069/g.103781 Transcript_36069/m.103781 type:complete len:213 (+) Transcript_36069:1181-1819(+)